MLRSPAVWLWWTACSGWMVLEWAVSPARFLAPGSTGPELLATWAPAWVLAGIGAGWSAVRRVEPALSRATPRARWSGIAVVMATVLLGVLLPILASAGVLGWAAGTFTAAREILLLAGAAFGPALALTCLPSRLGFPLGGGLCLLWIAWQGIAPPAFARGDGLAWAPVLCVTGGWTLLAFQIATWTPGAARFHAHRHPR